MNNEINYSSREPSFRIPFTTTKLVKEMFFYVQIAGVVYTKRDYSVHRKDFDSILLCYILKGRGSIKYRGESYALKRDDFFVIDCLEEHLYKSSKTAPLEMMFIHCSGPLSREYVKTILDFHPCLFQLDKLSRIKSLMGSILGTIRSKNSNAEILCSNKINSILTELLLQSKIKFTQHDTAPRFIQNMISFIESNYKTQISLEELSDRFAVSKYHLVRQFKKYTGSSPYDYLLKCRLDKAKYYLINTDISVGEIVYKTGFKDHSNFVRFFKNHEKTTPQHYRNSHKS